MESTATASSMREVRSSRSSIKWRISALSISSNIPVTFPATSRCLSYAHTNSAINIKFPTVRRKMVEFEGSYLNEWEQAFTQHLLLIVGMSRSQCGGRQRFQSWTVGNLTRKPRGGSSTNSRSVLEGLSTDSGNMWTRGCQLLPVCYTRSGRRWGCLYYKSKIKSISCICFLILNMFQRLTLHGASHLTHSGLDDRPTLTVSSTAWAELSHLIRATLPGSVLTRWLGPAMTWTNSSHWCWCEEALCLGYWLQEIICGKWIKKIRKCSDPVWMTREKKFKTFTYFQGKKLVQLVAFAWCSCWPYAACTERSSEPYGPLCVEPMQRREASIQRSAHSFLWLPW